VTRELGREALDFCLRRNRAFVGLDNPTSSQITRDLLGWTPTRSGLISDLNEDRNFEA
jgi:hypothetical protein